MSVRNSIWRSVAQPTFIAVGLACVGALAARNPVSGAIPAVISVIVFAFPSFSSVVRAKGFRAGAGALALFGLYALIIETIGIATGFPYGRFSYADGLGPKLFGLTPLTVAFAWTPILLAGHAVATRNKGITTAYALLVGTATMLLIDLAIDPGAVHAGYWGWTMPGAYFGVPLVNFFGWALTSVPALLTAKRLLPPASEAPGLATSASLTLAFWVGYLVSAGLYLPAAFGVMAIAHLRSLSRK